MTKVLTHPRCDMCIDCLKARIAELEAENEAFRAADYSALTDDLAQRMKAQMIAKVVEIRRRYSVDTEGSYPLLVSVLNEVADKIEKLEPVSNEASEVERCLAELREMFPDRAIIIRNDGSWPPFGPPLEFSAEIAVYGKPTFRKATLSEAMEAVREWKQQKEQ